MTCAIVFQLCPAKRSPGGPAEPHTHIGKRRKPMSWFSHGFMASGIARGRVRTTTATELPNMAAILQIGGEKNRLGLLCTSLTLDIHAMINWHLSKQGIRWPVSRDYIAGSSLQLVEVTRFYEADRWPSAGFLIGSQAHIKLTCGKQGRIVLKLD